ncbi:Tetratricopeptide TPR_2 repeat-containing protein [Caldithrix abyssi DSM 13497]|uniref:Tetratricopeptide TPR_2 repeat-containing protein n=1 Tax=Caldithrix abyssi DSM 13497 TaxID=880073 RepID=H1XXU2_CALAY|nr:tetratricopeptide repeat protein [Caldithrix abyssi]APF19645.1 Tetratricopeptide repeat-containing protein [Caldithrix abyssi DSM 13497]EHO39765.1 Tetratricopeptide TPR_2 repeat-containing protein [Caldithrix abyssi DSM 13497]
MIDLAKGIELFEKGKINQAEKHFKNILEKQKENPEVHFYLGRIAFQKDQYDAAISYFEKAIEYNPEEARYHEMYGETLGLKAQQAGMIKGAMMLRKVKAAFEKALSLNPESLMAREGLFMINLFAPGVAGGDEKKAMELFELIKKQNATHGHMAQALIHLKNNRLEEAEKEFELAVRQNGNDREILMRSARFFLQRKKYDRVLEIADLYIQHFPDDPRGYQLKGEAYLSEDNADEALNWFNLAIEKDDLFFNAYFHRAKVFLAKGKSEMAQKDVDFILNHPEASKEFKERAKKLMK